MQRNLPNLNQLYGSICDTDHVVVQNVFVSIYQKRIFPRGSDEHYRCRQLLGMHDMAVVESRFA